MKKLVVFISVLFVSINLFAQRIGQWNTHFSYFSDISQIVTADNNIVYALSDGKLFSYNSSDESVETYTKLDRANIDIVKIAYSKQNKSLIIVYSNSDIDLLYEGKRTVNIPDIKNMTLSLDKTINNIFVSDDFAYLSTNFGFLILNLKQEEVKESGIFKFPFYSMCLYEGQVIASSERGVLAVDSKLNMQDIANWKNFPIRANYHYDDYIFADADIRDIALFESKLHFLVPSKAIYILDKTTNTVDRVLQGEGPQRMLQIENHLIVSRSNLFWSFSSLKDIKSTNVDGLKYVVPNNQKTDEYWIAIKDANLSFIRVGGTQLEFLKTEIYPSGPLSNYPFFMTFDRNTLLVTGGGYDKDRFNYPAQLSLFQTNKWLYINKNIDKDARDFVSVISDPTDANHLFLCSWGEGLYEFRNGEQVHRFDNQNSVLESALGITGAGYVRVNGMSFDKYGNLWLQSSMAKHVVNVLQKKDGVIAQLYYPELDTRNTNARNLIIDRYNRKWFSTFAVDVFLFILDDKGTITNTADDQTVYLNQFYDQDGENLSVDKIYSTVEDKNGNIWVGTNLGIFVVYNSSNLLSKKIIFNKIKIPRNDGTNNADILLKNVPINAIAVDGANRKWIGTASGLYVVSENGQDMVHYFTMENSPLPSDNIISIAIDPSTGVAYIGSDRGVVSFRGEATQGADNFSNVSVFPNPVRPNYDGLITITGLQQNTNVKITDIKGNLINQGRSLGGQYIWDGRNVRNEKVDTGVYLVLGSSEDGSQGVVTKIMVVN